MQVVKSAVECMSMLDGMECSMLDFADYSKEGCYTDNYKLISNRAALKLIELSLPVEIYLHTNIKVADHLGIPADLNMFSQGLGINRRVLYGN